MNEEIKEQLEQEIVDELSVLNEVEFGSDQYKVGVEGLTKLLDRAIEIKKVEQDYEAKKESREFDREKFEAEQTEKARNREFDNKLQLDNAKNENRFKLAKVIVDIVIPAASITTGLFLAIKSFRFEEYGTITSTVGKASINKSLSRML